MVVRCSLIVFIQVGYNGLTVPIGIPLGIGIGIGIAIRIGISSSSRKEILKNDENISPGSPALPLVLPGDF